MNVIYSGFSDLGHVTVRGDDVQEVDAKLDEALPSMKEARRGDMLGSMYKTKLRDSEQLCSVQSRYYAKESTTKLYPLDGRTDATHDRTRDWTSTKE